MQFRFRALLQDEGWLSPAYVRTDADGVITSISDVPAEEATEAIDGFAIPGFMNAHSHAFQYAMAGQAEFFPLGQEDDFWTWRESMYRCAMSLNPDQVEAVAAMLYAEMVRVGFTHVAEFHYLHHDPNGRPYPQQSEMGVRLLRAAEQAGIGITLIPVLYQQGGFGVAPHEGQRRFICRDAEQYVSLFEETAEAVKQFAGARIGWSIHSLRAVDPEVARIVFRRMPEDIPFHIHAAEQIKEVRDCQDYCGLRPVEWLLQHLPVDERFFIVHATHLNDEELKKLAASGATAVLCPGTEGNLGDGFFRFREYARDGGNWCIGTDSHVTLDPLQELRMIDYRQRLLTHRRDTLEGDGAHTLMCSALINGRRAMGMSHTGFFEVGQPLDAVVYDAQAPRLAVADDVNRLASIVHTADASHILGTMRNGKWIVREGTHIHREVIQRAYASSLLGSSN